MSPSEPVPVQGLEGLLAETLGSGFKVTQLSWKPLTNPGENFGSVMLAIDLTLTRGNASKKMNLVAKLPPKSAYLLDLFNSELTFKKELYFYSRTMSYLKGLQLDIGVNENELADLAPQYIGGRLGVKDPDVFDEQAVIILENLRVKGYATLDRVHGMDRAHVEYAARELARLHAMVIALKVKKPALFENQVLRLIKQKVNKTAEKCVIDMVRKGQQDLKSLPGSQDYLDRIDKTVDYGIQYILGRQPEEPWGTMVHQDFWVNNMMFKHDEQGNVAGMKMVDFQLCSYDYGMCDLIFFLMSSSRCDVIDEHLDSLIDTYYEAFVRCLGEHKVDTAPFTRAKFDELMNYCAPHKFNQCIMMIQVIQASPKTTNDTTNLQGEQLFLSRVGDDVSNKKLAHTLSVFVKRGWLLK